jgi:uncharacterized protein (TIGR00369 family)
MKNRIVTHQRIDTRLCGEPIEVTDGSSRISLTADTAMVVDEQGLVHGGFIFGLADHAAMIAVNHPNVVLGASEVRFLKPVRTGDRVIAEARVTVDQGKKKVVEVVVDRQGEVVFSGSFTCFVLDRHVLD